MRTLRTPLALASLVALVALLLACDDDDDDAAGGEPTPRTIASAEATPTATPGDEITLTVVTHESFDVSTALVEQFEDEYNVTLRFIPAGDANEVVNRAILNAGNPEGDVLFGVDNLSFHRAVDAGVFTEFVAERRDEIPTELRAAFGDSALLTPIDFGYVTLNFDPAEGSPPQTLEELTQPRWRGKLVVEDPGRSSPGLQFLATTIAYFGEGRWQQFWRDLRENDVAIVGGWSEAYYSRFTIYEGDRPLVVSYTTSPAAEVFFAEEPIDEPPTVNVIPSPLFRQVEAAGILAGTEHRELAGEFIDFMLSDAFQRQIPETMFVYPVIGDLETPDFWQWAEVSVEPAQLEVSSDEITRWIGEWTEIMLR